MRAGGDPPGGRRGPYPGEYQPTKELVAVEMPRVQGPGWVAFDASGIEIHGAVFDVADWLPSRILAPVVVLVAMAGASFFGRPEIWLGVGMTLALLILVRGVMPRPSTYRVPWSAVQHVVRMPADLDVVCFVLERPLGRAGTPETVFFAPGSEGVPAFLASLRDAAPRTLAIDEASALLPSPVVDEVEEDEDGDL